MDHYLKKLVPLRPIECVEIRDADPELPVGERINREWREIQSHIDKKDDPVFLTEKARQLSSRDLALWLGKNDDFGPKRLCFIIGGPFGYPNEAPMPNQLSLSKMTLPHEFCRVFLLEQIYRAESILRHFPYHHG